MIQDERIPQTRVNKSSILFAYQENGSVDYVLEGYPSVPKEDVLRLIAWYTENKEEADEWLNSIVEECAKRSEDFPSPQTAKVRALREKLGESL